MSIKILLADDHKIVRDGLRALLEKQPNIQIVAETGDGRSALQLATELKPHLVIMDISMPDLNGMDATRKILEKVPGVRIIVLSMHSDKRFVAEVLRAGASGYLLKDCAFEELARAIRTVLANKTYLSPDVADIVLKDYIRNIATSSTSAFDLLTAREREVLQSIAEGKSTKEIAAELSISIKTIETYRKRIMEKLSLGNVADLTKYAIREGLTSLESSISERGR